MKNKIKYFAASLVTFAVPALAWAQSIAPKDIDLPGGNATIIGILDNVMRWLLGILGILAIIGFIISGILYLTSAGDEERITRAKKALTYSIIGVLVGLSGVVIITAVEAMLSGSSSNF